MKRAKQMEGWRGDGGGNSIFQFKKKGGQFRKICFLYGGP